METLNRDAELIPMQSPSPLDDNQVSGSLRAFRVRGVPKDWTEEVLGSFLTEQYSSEKATVESLAIETNGRSKTATISFQIVPTLLADRDSKISIRGPKHQLKRGQTLTLDDGFHGMTTLYAPPSEDHRFE